MLYILLVFVFMRVKKVYSSKIMHHFDFLYQCFTLIFLLFYTKIYLYEVLLMQVFTDNHFQTIHFSY